MWMWRWLLVLAAMSICLIVCQSATHNCGNNPLQAMMKIANNTGQSLDSVLKTLKNRHKPLLNAVLKKYKQYSACTRLLDTGYFKRLAGRAPLSDRKTLQYHRGDIDLSDFLHWSNGASHAYES